MKTVELMNEMKAIAETYGFTVKLDDEFGGFRNIYFTNPCGWHDIPETILAIGYPVKSETVYVPEFTVTNLLENYQIFKELRKPWRLVYMSVH